MFGSGGGSLRARNLLTRHQHEGENSLDPSRGEQSVSQTVRDPTTVKSARLRRRNNIDEGKHSFWINMWPKLVLSLIVPSSGLLWLTPAKLEPQLTTLTILWRFIPCFPCGALVTTLGRRFGDCRFCYVLSTRKMSPHRPEFLKWRLRTGRCSVSNKTEWLSG